MMSPVKKSVPRILPTEPFARKWARARASVGPFPSTMTMLTAEKNQAMQKNPGMIEADEANANQDALPAATPVKKTVQIRLIARARAPAIVTSRPR